MATYERIDYGSPDGSRWGISTDLLGMYGAIPSTQYTLVPAASTFATFNQSTGTASTWGFPDAISMTSFIVNVSTLVAACKRFGIVS